MTPMVAPAHWSKASEVALQALKDGISVLQSHTVIVLYMPSKTSDDAADKMLAVSNMQSLQWAHLIIRGVFFPSRETGSHKNWLKDFEASVIEAIFVAENE